jgi:ABC-type lipoprotein export system ATPase subunit
MTRKEVYQTLARALAGTRNPRTVFCIQPFATVKRDHGRQLGTMLARLMTDTNNAFLISTSDAFIFAFGNKLGANERQAPFEREADLQESSPP